MIRFMGFATGAAVAVGFMLFLFGAPKSPEIAPEPAVVTPPMEQPPVATETPAPEPLAAQPTVEPVEDSAELEPSAAPPPVEAPIVEALAASEPVEVAPVLTETAEPETRIAVADNAPERDLQWHAFWSPFRSRIAANGFVSRLESVTGFDYRVVQVDTGVYEVAVGYASDDERRNKLAAIAEATGLEMPDS